MGCGCNKNRKDKLTTRAPREKLVKRLAVSSQQSIEKNERRKLVEKKLKFCRNCQNSLPTKEERREKKRICHKCDKSIQSILNDKSFKCPINNF